MQLFFPTFPCGSVDGFAIHRGSPLSDSATVELPVNSPVPVGGCEVEFDGFDWISTSHEKDDRCHGNKLPERVRQPHGSLQAQQALAESELEGECVIAGFELSLKRPMNPTAVRERLDERQRKQTNAARREGQRRSEARRRIAPPGGRAMPLLLSLFSVVEALQHVLGICYR